MERSAAGKVKRKRAIFQMAISPLIRIYCLFLGTVGLVQGLILATLTLLGLLVHLCAITVAPDETLTRFIPLLVGLYFQGAECQVYNTTVLYNDYFTNLVTPEWLFIWIAVYFGVSVLWIIFSVLIMNDRIFKAKTLHYFLPWWIFLTLGNCAMDLVLATYFGVDYSYLVSNTEVNGTSLLPVVPFAMSILALKGVVMWLINFIASIFAIIALRNFMDYKHNTRPLFLERAGFLNRSPIDGFAPIEMPRPSSLPLNTSFTNQNISTVSALRNYYMINQEPRSILQSPISEIPSLNRWRKPTLWDIPDPDYSPTSTVTRLKNETDCQSNGLRPSLYNPILPLRPSLKRTQQNFERKEDITL